MPLNYHRKTFEIIENVLGLQFQPILNGFYATQTFFYLSGLLTTFVTFKYTNGDYRKFRYIPFILIRYLRLTPQLIIFLLLANLTQSFIDNSTLSIYSEQIKNKCSKTWWHNLFYIQNLFNHSNIVSIFIKLLLRNYRIGMMVTKIFLLIFLPILSVIIYIQKFPPGIIASN
ncbi:hypothetical protein BLA29_009582, partial [Euroglyphus maynei]